MKRRGTKRVKGRRRTRQTRQNRRRTRQNRGGSYGDQTMNDAQINYIMDQSPYTLS